MSEKKPIERPWKGPGPPPEKVVEPSPIEKIWAEIQAWRSGREVKLKDKRLRKAEHFNNVTRVRRGRGNRASKRAVIGFFGFIGSLIMGFFELFIGLFRFAIWIGVVGGIIWVLSNMEEFSEDATLEAVKEKAVEVQQHDKVEAIIQGLQDTVEEIKQNWYIEIRTKGEDGETKVIEWGTKKPEPEPEPSELSEPPEK